jgi:putative component of toxin-antitoxin plasmid stabilization module
MTTWKQAATVIGAVTGAIALGGFALPLLRSDSPPFAGIQRVDDFKRSVHDAKNEIRADIMYSRVFNLRVAQCAAIKGHNPGLSRAIAEQISEAERIYQQITGRTVMISMCGEL